MNRNLTTPTAIRAACASAAIAMTLGVSSFIDFLATRHVAEGQAIAATQPALFASAATAAAKQR